MPTARSHTSVDGHQNEAVFYILKGKGYEIHDDKRYDWEAGDLVVVHTDSVHRHFNDGDETGHHRHACDYIVVPVTGGTFGVEEPDGTTRELAQVAGAPYQGRAGTEHNVVNRSGRTVSFVEIELKR